MAKYSLFRFMHCRGGRGESGGSPRYLLGFAYAALLLPNVLVPSVARIWGVERWDHLPTAGRALGENLRGMGADLFWLIMSGFRVLRKFRKSAPVL